MERDRPRQVVCLLIESDGKLLLEQRLDKTEFFEAWMFTGGKVDPQDHEHPDPLHAAAAREAWEETGLTVSETREFARFEQTLRDGNLFEFIGMLVVAWSGELSNPEVGRRNLAWVQAQQAAEFIGEHEVDRPLLQAYFDYVSQNQTPSDGAQAPSD